MAIILCSLEMAWFLSSVVLAYLLGPRGGYPVDQVVKWGAGLSKGRSGRSITGVGKRIGLSKTCDVPKAKVLVQGVGILVKSVIIFLVVRGDSVTKWGVLTGRLGVLCRCWSCLVWLLTSVVVGLVAVVVVVVVADRGFRPLPIPNK